MQFYDVYYYTTVYYYSNVYAIVLMKKLFFYFIFYVAKSGLLKFLFTLFFIYFLSVCLSS